MIFYGQRLAALWIARQQEKGKQFPITDPALRYRLLIRASAILWAVALTYVFLAGIEHETSGKRAIGQWVLVATAAFGWIPILVFFIKRRGQLALQSDGFKTIDPNLNDRTE